MEQRKFIESFIPNLLFSITFLFFVSFFSGCARPGSLQGGEKDIVPPKLDSLNSTLNFQTNFKKQKIELIFDEWIKLNDVFNQVIISPPLEYKYDISLKKKTVKIEFAEEEVLRDSATYTINFGDAIKDITEGNVALLKFVFSTGDFIDSLSLKGQIVDAHSGEPVENVLFMLYDNISDTVVRTERPFYFSKTSKDGNFTINNVKAGKFKGFALEDINLNYLFDLDNERIGFPDSLIIISDTTNTFMKIRFFTQEQPLKLLEDEQKTFGYLNLVFNRKPYDIDFIYDENISFFYQKQEKDSIKIWYDLKEERDWDLIIKSKDLLDTLKIKSDKQGKEDLIKTAKLNWKQGSIIQRQNPANPLKLVFNFPVKGIDTSKIVLFEDTLKKVVLPSFNKIDGKVAKEELFCSYPWKEDVNYELMLLPDAVTSVYGFSNTDTLKQTFKTLQKKNFGNIVLKILNLDTSKYYVVKVMKNDNQIEKHNIHSVKAQTFEYKSMPTGDYSVQIIEDTNKNGRWDTGNYDMQIQPEKIYRKAIETLRANWDVEVEFSLP